MAPPKAERNRQIIEALRRGESPIEIARRHEISRQRVHQIKAKAIARGMLRERTANT